MTYQSWNQQTRLLMKFEQNILLLASAGTGKTNTLAYRVAHLIEGGYAKAENILCMTFTNKAAKEMKRPHSIARRQSCKGCGG